MRILIFYILGIIGLILMGSNSFAQMKPKTCDLQLLAFEDKLGGRPGDGARRVIENETTWLNGATAVARRVPSKTIIHSYSIDDTPVFSDLKDGTYKVTVSRDGYRSMKKSFTIDCSRADKAGVLNKSFNLNFGDSHEPAETNRRVDVMTKMGSVDTDTPPLPVRKVPSRTVSGGVLNGKATVLPKPVYPPVARAVKAGGACSVQVLIDESGNVISANAVSGHPLLRTASEAAARTAKFSPTLVDGIPVKVSGVITYNFVP